MKNISDDELIDNYNFNYLVNYAVGIRTLGEINLAERTLYNFLERVYQYLVQHPEKEDLIFGQFLRLTINFAEKAGVSMDVQRMDTTMFMSNIKKAGRLALAFDVLRMAVETIPNTLRPEHLMKVLEPKFKTDTLYHSKPSEGSSKLDTLLNLCFDAREVLRNRPETEALDELRILERFLSEQAVSDEKTGRFIAKENKSISTDSLQSAYDEDATFRRKVDKSQSGYVLAVSETCDKKNPVQFITDYKVEKNNVSDVEIIQDRLPKNKENTGCKELYVDGGFNSPDTMETAQKNHVNLHFTNLSGTQPSKKLSANAYEIDEQTNVIRRCPMDVEPLRAGVKGGQTVAHFPTEACQNCELRDQCHVKQQKKNCVVRIPLKSVQAARERSKMEASRKENTSMRAGIEGTNSALKRGHGLAKVMVRGITKCAMVAGFKVIAQNFKRFARCISGTMGPSSPEQGVTVNVG